MPRLSPFTEDKKLSALFAEETAKASQSRLYHLVSLDIPGAVEDDPLFRIVDSNYDVTFAGETYLAFPVKVNPAAVNTDGTIDKTSIIIANVSRVMMEYVEVHNGLRNRRVSIKTVYENALDFTYTPNADGTVTAVDNPTKNDTAYLEDEYFIDTYTANEQIVTFTLEPILDLQVRIPRRRYMTDTCYWKYMDSDTCRHNGVFADSQIALTAGSSAITIGQLEAASEIAFSLTNILSYEEYLAVTGFDDIQSVQEAYEADLALVMSGQTIMFAFHSNYADYQGRRPTVSTLISVGSDPTRYSIMSVKDNVNSTGEVVSWACTVSPIPETSVTGTLYFLTCNKTLADCKFRKNVTNYGGFPGVSGSRRIML